MTPEQKQSNLLMTIVEALSSCDDDKMKPILEAVLNAVMTTERDMALQAAPYERSQNRPGYANGFKLLYGEA